MMLCPYGHDDATESGYCGSEVIRMIESLRAERSARSGRGDLSGALYTARHLRLALRRLTGAEQKRMIKS